MGFKPTYGLISRYGVVSYAHSLDTVGIFSRDVDSAESLFSISFHPSKAIYCLRVDILNVYDKHDPTLIPTSTRSKFPSTLPSKFTFGIPQEYNLPSLHPSTRKALSISLSSLQKSGHLIRKVSLPRTKEALSAYYLIATAEAASNLARYDGVRYGYHSSSPSQQDYKNNVLASRAEGFGEEVRRRILLGNYTLSTRYESQS